MASITRQAHTRYWIGCFRDLDGKQKRRSTKTTDRKLALKLVTEWENAWRNRKTVDQLRRVLSDYHEEIAGEALSTATLKDYAAQWLSAKEGVVTSVSYSAYKSAVNSFVAALPNRANLGIQYVTRSDVRKFRDECAAKATAKTANNKLKIIRTFLEDAWREGFIAENPAKKVPVLPTEESNRRPFTEAEIQKVLAAANEEWRGMVLFGLYTGQRLKDIATMCWAHIDLVEGLWSFTTSKTGRQQSIATPSDA